MKKYVAFDAANHEWVFFDNITDAEKWLIGDYDWSEGFPEELIDGDYFIAKIILKSTVKVMDKIENYPCLLYNRAAECSGCDEKECEGTEEWPYDSDTEWAGDVKMVQIPETKICHLCSEPDNPDNDLNNCNFCPDCGRRLK